MGMVAVKVYDPPMCCSTGVCGPSVDPELIRFARDVAWLKHNGVEVARFNEPTMANSPLSERL